MKISPALNYLGALVFTSLGLLAQNVLAGPGTVEFANHNDSKVINGHTGAPITSDDAVRVALYWSPLGSSSFVQIGTATNIGVPVAGIFTGGARTCGAATQGGTTGEFQVRAWGGGFATYEQAHANSGVLLGQSAIVQVVTGNPDGDPPTVPAALLSGGLQSFSLLTNIAPLSLVCATNKTVACGDIWTFDPPAIMGGCVANPTLIIWSTTTNGPCPWLITRTWQASDSCVTNYCSQTVTVVDSSPLAVIYPNKAVSCDTNWSFDPPVAISGCESHATVSLLDTVTNNFCPQMITRTWSITNTCNGASTLCSQTVTVLCSDCPVLIVTKACPPYPVPPGGLLNFTGTVTNLSGLTLTNVIVRNDKPAANTLVFGPATLAPGGSATFSGSYDVSPLDSGPYTDTLIVSGVSLDGLVFSNSVTASCARATVITPGDRNGDGIVDQGELNAVLANYWPSNPLLLLTNTAGLGGTNVTFALSNSTAGSFTVEYTTNMVDWEYLGPATPRYEFIDTNAPAMPGRFYRLRWP